MTTTSLPTSPCRLSLPKLLASGALALALTLPAAGMAAQTMDKDELQQVYTRYLDEQGFRPTVSDMGNVLFKSEGRTYVIYLDPKDAAYFRIVLSFKADDGDETLRNRRLEALNEVNRTMKTVKSHIGTDGNINFSVEMFQAKVGDANKDFARTLRAMGQAVTKYGAKMKDKD